MYSFDLVEQWLARSFGLAFGDSKTALKNSGNCPVKSQQVAVLPPQAALSSKLLWSVSSNNSRLPKEVK